MISTQMRRLDYDDMIVLRGLLQGLTVGQCSKLLGLTQPAVSIRIRKMEHVFGWKIVHRLAYYPQKNMPAKLTKIGIMAAEAAVKVLEILESVDNRITELSKPIPPARP